ncbi:aldose 1-epimerase [Chitinophaga niastensis]|uniref:Aldose 1-epimerase n=1 Tax=Chitinophaga niastensis TaxID=536980 RepID=A0A2P8HN80_CHINA|nr:aldose 1-epimerase [Chitinophaga niastensis]PSL47673.1 aldose 1-epimerase [Chitinophaga niastensis]
MKFGIHSFHEAGFDIIALTDQQTGTQVEIIPSHGAMLHAFKVKHHQETLNLIDGYKSLQDLEENLRISFKSVKLSPYACRIKDAQYIWEGQTYNIQKTIAPGNAIHGLLYDAAFSITAQQADEQQATVTLSYSFKKEDTGYPFTYDCIATYTLRANNELQVSTIIVNHSAATIPLMDGWHPYFSTGTPVDELVLTFASKEIVEFDAKLIPTGKVLPYTEFISGKKLAGVELDNSFVLDFTNPQPLATLHDPKKNINITFYPGNNYPILQIYIPPHRNSIAVENLSGAPNAFNNGLGLVQLAAGESKTFDTRIQVTL